VYSDELSNFLENFSEESYLKLKKIVEYIEKSGIKNDIDLTSTDCINESIDESIDEGIKLSDKYGDSITKEFLQNITKD
jgi:DNA-binding ferritin-like protein